MRGPAAGFSDRALANGLMYKVIVNYYAVFNAQFIRRTSKTLSIYQAFLDVKQITGPDGQRSNG
jgi:hypothetical protein